MPATTVDSTKFQNPTYPRKLPAGVNIEPFSEVIATTSLADVGDRIRLLPLPTGVEIIQLVIEHTVDGDSGGPTLDADLVIHDDDGDTILYDAGTAFGAAIGTVVKVIPLGTKAVKAEGDTGTGQSGVASLDLKVNVAATTPVQFTIRGNCYYVNVP